MRKLLPLDARNDDNTEIRGSNCNDEVVSSSNDKCKGMEIVDDFSKSDFQGEDEEDSGRGGENARVSAGEEVWEECGCVLWDLAANQTHAELMVQNLILEVLLANLMVTQSVRVTEICLGIMGNLACHEVPMKHMVSTNGLISVIVDQLFLDDTQCLGEACRLLSLGLQGSECRIWAEALQSEHILSRILWVTENTLNPQLIEKSVGLLLAMLESQKEVEHILLLPLMKLGLATVLVNLLAFEMSKLTNERIPERYSVLDVILRALEALCVLDGYSQEICSNKEFFQLVCDLIKFPDKVEVSNSCVTAGVIIANILSDVSDLASDLSQDLPFLQGLFDIFPFTSDELEARCALWSIIARLLVRVQEDEMSASSLRQYVFILSSKADLIEDDLFDHQFDENKENESLATCGRISNARTFALRRIISILNKWNSLKDSVEEKHVMEEHANDENIHRLLDCCHKYTVCSSKSLAIIPLISIDDFLIG
ncbi:ARM repeat superfamily protein, putative isoform 3 [Theobroma cacao]|uniref:ARM repeat superfamily protein, putative isoform 3 n=1 Tax=Theobroma cacao TaxID=3641 RepID=A0A061GUT6_THECC|nr:ARM repeat superfamily protein, putative isoform 3 [Theobroma cacao]